MEEGKSSSRAVTGPSLEERAELLCLIPWLPGKSLFLQGCL